MTGSIILTLDEWIKMIHSQITVFSQHAKDVRIHKEKLSTLFEELKYFNQKTATKKFSPNPPNPTETNSLRAVMSLFTSIQKFMDSCTQSKMIETIINQDVNEPLTILQKFRTGFNQFVINFKILDQEACTCDNHQLAKDNIYDSKTIIDIISTYFKENKAIQKDSKDSLEKRKKEYQDIIDNSQQVYEDENDENRIVSEAEYLKRIQEISNCFVDPNDFQQNEQIGRGGFGTVYLGIQKSTGKVVAIKHLNFKSEFKVSDLKSLIYEVSIMSKIRHYGILPLVGYIQTKPYRIITEFMSGGTLNERLFNSKGKHLDGTKLTIIALGVAYAMKFIHNQKYIHRDLKPDNIILDADDYPYVIDFGLSRLLPKDEQEYMSFGKGTLSYMAPELLSESEPYTTAIDVYAYGISLWVMLTGQHPFSKKIPMFQLIRRIVAGDRPKIPTDAGTIGPLIEKCWNSDPKRRPKFDEIVTILETGEVFFPGTNRSQVNSYKNIYKKKTEEIKPPTKIVEEKPEKIQEVDVKDLQTQLESVKLDASSTAIDKIERNINNKGYLEKLLQSPKFLQSLMNACDSCESLVSAQKIIKIFIAVLKIQKKIDHQCIAKVLGLFVKLGSTEMTEILDFINAFPESELAKIKLSVNQLNRLAPFLKHSDISLRVNATNTLIKIIQNKSYKNIDCLKLNIKELISNLVSSVSSMQDLLLSSLIAINILLPLKELHKDFFDGNIFNLAVSVFTYDQKNNENIYKEACKTLRIVIKNFRGELTEDHMKIAILSLPQASLHVTTSQLTNYVTVLVNLLELNAFYSAIEKNSKSDSEDNFQSCFESFLETSKSDESIVILLKICYSLLNDESTHDCLASISSCYLNFILNTQSSKSQKSIQSIATCCLIQSIDDKNISSLFTEDLKKFIKKSLKSKKVQNESTLNSLRLCSALASRRKGVECLMNENIIELIEFYLNSDDKITVKLAVMIYSSFSAIYPGSDRMVSSVSKFLKMMNNKDYEDLLPYISSFLANATISSDAAVECAKNISDISSTLDYICTSKTKEVKDDKEEKKNKTFIIYKIISTLINIVVCQNALKCIVDSKAFTVICKAAKEPFCADLLGCFLDFFARISRTKLGNEAISKSSLSNYLKVKVSDMKPDDFRRALILRLLAVSS